MLLKCYERCWPCHKPVLPYYLYISYAFICLNDPQSLSWKLGCHCSTLRPEATQLATPESDYLAAWQRKSGGFSHCSTMICHDMSWYVMICHDMSWYVMICHDMSWYVMICHDMSWYVMICHDMSWYVMICHDMSWYVMICHDMSWYVMICHDMSWYVMICHDMSWYVMICHDMSWYVMICHDMSWYVMICHDMSWYVMICHDMSWYVMYDSVWLSMTQYDSVWLSMTQYDSVWPCTTTAANHQGRGSPRPQISVPSWSPSITSTKTRRRVSRYTRDCRGFNRKWAEWADSTGNQQSDQSVNFLCLRKWIM